MPVSYTHLINKSKYGVITIENHLDIGGLGTAVADIIAENGLGKRLVKIGLPGYPHGASKMYLMKKYGIDAMHLVEAVEELTGKKLGIQEDDLENCLLYTSCWGWLRSWKRPSLFQPAFP